MPEDPAEPMLWRGHAGLVTLAIIGLIVGAVVDGPDPGRAPNAGAYFAAFPLILLGLPWSLVLPRGLDALGLELGDLPGPLPSIVFIAEFATSAAINVAAHVLLYRWSRRRRDLAAPW